MAAGIMEQVKSMLGRGWVMILNLDGAKSP